MRSQHLLILFITLLILIPTASALGVVPSSKDITYEAGKTITYQLKIINNEAVAKQVFLYTEGEIGHLLSIDKAAITFSEGQTEDYITVSMQLPSSTNWQGKKTAKIVIREVASGGGQIGAALSMNSIVTLNVPYEGTYAETRLFIGEFEVGKQGNFVVEVNNLGTQDITAAQSRIDIINPRTGNIVASTNSEEKRVPKKQKVHLSASWTPNIPQGIYTVSATTTYDGQTTTDQKLLTLGSQEVEIQHITVDNFVLGGIAKFDIVLENKWSDTINNIYAEIAIKKGEEKYATSTTQTVSIPALSKQEVNAYWDTEKVVPGNYELQIKLFNNDQVSEKNYPITVTENGINTGFTTGQVIGAEKGEAESTLDAIYLLVLLVLVVLVINVVLFYKFMKKK